jgi:hypothetical protein
MRTAALLLIASGCLIAACGGGSSQDYEITGSLTLTDSDGWEWVGDTDNAVCTGEGGYSDIGAGTQIVVKDGSGEILGTGSLDAGKEAFPSCVFTFTVSELPRSDFYSVESGRRGSLSYSFEEMEDQSWIVFLSLGD